MIHRLHMPTHRSGWAKEEPSARSTPLFSYWGSIRFETVEWSERWTPLAWSVRVRGLARINSPQAARCSASLCGIASERDYFYRVCHLYRGNGSGRLGSLQGDGGRITRGCFRDHMAVTSRSYMILLMG